MCAAAAVTKSKDFFLNAEKDLLTIGDYIRFAVSRFNEAGLVYGHGTQTAFEEAVFLLSETLNLSSQEDITPYLDARLTVAEKQTALKIIQERIKTRKPAAYLLNKAYLQGLPFYVDERVIVPRSFIAELLVNDDLSLIKDAETIESVLDLCTGSGCLAVLAAHLFPNAQVDAVDISKDALAVAQINVKNSGYAERITLLRGDLFAPIKNKKYDLIISNPPYVDAIGMEGLPPEYQHEPALALASGKDGTDITRKILKSSADYLNRSGTLICEIGRCKETLEAQYPTLPFLWLDTENSTGEVFMLTREQLVRKQPRD